MFKKGVCVLLVCFLGLSVCCGCRPPSGELLTIKDAFEAGLISHEDLMEISYQRFGKVLTYEDPHSLSSEWVEIDYTSTKTIPEINKRIEEGIKRAYYELYHSSFIDERDGTVLGGPENVFVDYYGEYNGLYAAFIRNDLWSFSQELIGVYVDGIAWTESRDGFWLFHRT